MSRTCLHCWDHVQRLRVHGEVPCTSGSRGLVPGILRSLLSLCCSNPRRGYVSPVECVLARLPVRLCECEPWVISRVKSVGVSNHSEIPAKIAAFQGQALSRIHYHFHTTACWLGVRTGTFPPLIPRCPRLRGPRRISCHGPPKGPHPETLNSMSCHRCATGPSLSN